MFFHYKKYQNTVTAFF